ncbi:unnamed protein product, partial [Ascophyllum nodosum]
MTQGYRPGGACRSCGTIPRKSSRSPGPFLVVSHRARSLRNLLVSGNECGRVFPAGVGP